MIIRTPSAFTEPTVDTHPADPDAAHLALAEVGERIGVAATLLESSRLLTELLRFVAPELQARTARITALVVQIVDAMALDEPWEFEVAARLSQIGCLALPPSTRDAALNGDPLSDEDERAIASHPLLARDLLGDVRRLEGVREMVGRQREPFAVGEPSPAAREGVDRVSLGGQVLKVAGDLDELVSQGLSVDEAIGRLRARGREYNDTVLDALEGAIAASTAVEAAA